ncbi:NAD(P)H-binding protein [Diaminobutyricibacter tongyongensis]|uniref:NAD(P)H-binding protein n=1 Tax=Leifsonia tongyongensis TaxID=1268043 RepID=A0A6L9XY95_9MICO|nr:NAD(P)H-binding protein [Diaminobutyricibacter tongyongensis]NEN05948.1 NAD(P)H-binding protein [Diaminobutyricibacter tongyongensis]
MILVTGASGTLGRTLVADLVARGEQVRVLTRDASRVPADGVEVVVADLRDTPAVERAMNGCEVVVLAAHGFVGPRGISPETIDRDANIAAIGRAAEAGVRHIVLVSAYGASADHPMSLHRAKFAAERALKATNLTWTIIRPTPFLETWTGIVGAHVGDRHQAIVFGPGANLIDFVPVAVVADAITAAIGEHPHRNREFDVTGGRCQSFTGLAEAAVAASPMATGIRHVPLGMLRMLARAAKPFAPAFARQARAAVVMNTTDMTARRVSAPTPADT